jgi:hypothetical protein
MFCNIPLLSFTGGHQDDKRKVETPCKAAGVGGTNTGLPQQRPVSAGVVQTRRNNAATYYRWERELLALAEAEPCSSVSAVRSAELPAPKRVSCNVAERSATLHIGNASLDIYPGCDTEQLKMLVELLRLC